MASAPLSPKYNAYNKLLAVSLFGSDSRDAIILEFRRMCVRKAENGAHSSITTHR
jgi:hypothetical protein